jgi:hypothetical protein
MGYGAADGRELVHGAYAAFTAVLDRLGEEDSWRPTGCTGWAVRDLTYHCLGDARRALVALHTPAAQEPDRDAVTYWRDWAPDPVGAANGRRHARVGASMFLHWGDLRGLYAETAAAVVEAARHADPHARVRTQGHVLAAGDLLSTLAVEATIHHLDLTLHLHQDPPRDPARDLAPDAAGLGEVRRILDGLLGGAPDPGWSDERFARVATGRAAPTAGEAQVLGAVLDRFPVFS